MGPELREKTDRGHESAGCERAPEISAAAERPATEKCVYVGSGNNAVDAWVSACQVAETAKTQVIQAGRRMTATRRKSERARKSRLRQYKRPAPAAPQLEAAMAAPQLEAAMTAPQLEAAAMAAPQLEAVL